MGQALAGERDDDLLEPHVPRPTVTPPLGGSTAPAGSAPFVAGSTNTAMA
ncbi:hypothetical protein [Nakamurella sp. PAMC28650]|nr:hypothetical protein [Nakamurella sp. PAMC28650]QNK82895.1 hypothetical protein H7F38_09610 [Nakamurella sp. PAMC28650]